MTDNPLCICGHRLLRHEGPTGACRSLDQPNPRWKQKKHSSYGGCQCRRFSAAIAQIPEPEKIPIDGSGPVG